MTSLAKIAANQSNSRKSTGPRTTRGKSRSRFNAVKSGMYSVHRPLLGEDQKAYQRLFRRLKRLYQPTEPVEELLVDQILGHIWRVGRLEQAEKAYLLATGRARAIRQCKFDLSLKPLVTKDKASDFSSSKIEYSAGTSFSGAELVDDLEDTLFEAAIGRAEKEPLRYLMEQRSAHLNRVLWLETELNRRRRGLPISPSAYTNENKKNQ